MVLVVQAHVVSEHVQWPVIRKGFWDGYKVAGFSRTFRLWVEHIMLGNKVACTRMQRAGKERAHDQVHKSSAASIAQENVIEGELGDDIEEVDSGQWQLVDHHWTERVEEDLKGAKKGLA